jgi:hypothetical protein
MNYTTILIIGLLGINIPLSKTFKEIICLQLTKKRDFKDLDTDLIVRGLVIVVFFIIEFGVVAMIKEIFFPD